MKKLIVACTLSLFAASAWCELTAKAVWDSAAKTFTFYYDENTYEGDGITQYAIPTVDKWNTYPDWNPDGAKDGPKTSVTNVVFDVSFAGYQPVSLNCWFSGFSKLKGIEHLDYLDTSKTGYATYLFNECSSLTSLDLSNFDTTKMLFREFFHGCSNIEELDLTSFTRIKDTRSMFSGMTKLKTIYVTELLVIDTSANTDDKEFSGCSALVGGAGTAYAAVKVATRDYARIDGGPESDTPGYFTLGQKPVPPVIASVTAWDLTHNSVTIVVEGETLNDGTITVELVAGGVTEKTEVLRSAGYLKKTSILTCLSRYPICVRSSAILHVSQDRTTHYCTTGSMILPTIRARKKHTISETDFVSPKNRMPSYISEYT